jgi:IS5 family transposase
MSRKKTLSYEYLAFPLSHSMINSQYSFFDLEKQLDKIYQLNDVLPNLHALIDWQIFRADLNKEHEKTGQSHAGRPPFDTLLMFKILILKSLYNLSDENTELQIRDRISFRLFLGLDLCDAVPDAKTIWLFAERLKQLGLERVLFHRFHAELHRQGFTAKSGSIVDSSFVEVPKQRNTRKENAQIKQGEIPETLSANPHVLAQKDTDVRWTKKNKVSYFGYKAHVRTDTEYKLIQDYTITDASVHDSVPFLDLVPAESSSEGQAVYGDSAYVGKAMEKDVRRRGYVSQICEKGYRNKPLTEE